MTMLDSFTVHEMHSWNFSMFNVLIAGLDSLELKQLLVSMLSRVTLSHTVHDVCVNCFRSPELMV